MVQGFLTKNEKSFEETLDYIKCMTLTQNVDPKVYNYLTNGNIAEVNRYIEAPMTATYFLMIKRKSKPGTGYFGAYLLLDDCVERPF